MWCKWTFKVEWHPPSLRLPSSAACPEWNTVFTKIPMLPFGESRPPTTLNPRDFLPGPLWNVTVKRDSDRDFGLLGSVPAVAWRPTPTEGATLRLHCRGVTWSNWYENFLIPVTTWGLFSVSLHLQAITISTSRGQFLSVVRASWSVIPRSRWPFTFTSSSPTWKRPSLDKHKRKGQSFSNSKWYLWFWQEITEQVSIQVMLLTCTHLPALNHPQSNKIFWLKYITVFFNTPQYQAM